MCCIVPKYTHIFVLSMRESQEGTGEKNHTHLTLMSLSDFLIFPSFGLNKTHTQ